VVDALQRRRVSRSGTGASTARAVRPQSSRSPWHSTTTSCTSSRASRARGASVPVFPIEAAEAVAARSSIRQGHYDPERVFANSFGIFVEDKYAVERIEVSLAPRWPRSCASHRWHRSQSRSRRRAHPRPLRVRLCPRSSAGAELRARGSRRGPPSLRRRIAHLARQMGGCTGSSRARARDRYPASGARS